MEEKKELLTQECYDNTEKGSVDPAQVAAEFLNWHYLIALKSRLLGEIDRIKGYPADNHLSYVVYKDARKLLAVYEEELYKYRENYKESKYSDCFLTEHDLKIIRQIIFMDEYEKEVETSSEYRELIEEYEEACAELEKSNVDSKDLPDGILTADEMEGADPDTVYDSLVAFTNHVAGALAPITRWRIALTKLAEYEVKYETVRAITNSIISDMRKEKEKKELNNANELTQEEKTLEKTDNDDTMSSTPKAEAKTDVEKETPKLIIPTQEEDKTNGLCITGFVLGILSMFSYWLLPILLPMLAVIVSGVGLSEITETKEKGKGMAIWGLVLGIIYTIQSFIQLTLI